MSCFMMRPISYIAYPILVVLLVRCQAEKKEKEAASDERVLTVKTTRVESLRPEKVIVLPGELKAWDRVDIFSKTRGFVTELRVDRGTVVKKGQVLAKLEADELVAQLNHAHAELQSRISSLHEANAKFKASKSMYARLVEASKTRGAISPNELEQMESKMLTDSSLLLSAKERVTSGRELYKGQQKLVDYLTITAPFDGVIMERNISPGTLVGPEINGQKPLFVLVNSSTLRLTVAIPEIHANSIQPTAHISFSVSTIPGKKFKANYARSAQNIDNHVRVMITEFDVPNPQYLLKAGTYADVHLPIQRSGATLFVPNKAVVTSSEKVFVIKASKQVAQWIEVKKGTVVDSLTEIFGDLKEGDLIVKKASEEIRDGQRIQVD